MKGSQFKEFHGKCKGKFIRYFASSEEITVIKLYNLLFSTAQFLVKSPVVDVRRSRSSKLVQWGWYSPRSVEWKRWCAIPCPKCKKIWFWVMIIWQTYWLIVRRNNNWLRLIDRYTWTNAGWLNAYWLTSRHLLTRCLYWLRARLTLLAPEWTFRACRNKSSILFIFSRKFELSMKSFKLSSCWFKALDRESPSLILGRGSREFKSAD